MWFWLKISIYQSGIVHGECWVNCPTRAGNLEASTVCWGEATRRVQLSGYQAAADRVQVIAVEDLVVSQEDKPKRHRSAREISHETHSPFKCAQDSSPWPPALMLQTMSCLSVVWSQSHLPCHSLIKNLTVCNKSCYCSLINRKLNNK